MKLSASCTPFEALPPPVWEGFKRAVMETARQWGLEIAVSSDMTIRDAQERFWQMTRVMDNARADEAAKRDE